MPQRNFLDALKKGPETDYINSLIADKAKAFYATTITKTVMLDGTGDFATGTEAIDWLMEFVATVGSAVTLQFGPGTFDLTPTIPAVGNPLMGSAALSFSNANVTFMGSGKNTTYLYIANTANTYISQVNGFVIFYNLTFGDPDNLQTSETSFFQCINGVALLYMVEVIDVVGTAAAGTMSALVIALDFYTARGVSDDPATAPDFYSSFYSSVVLQYQSPPSSGLPRPAFIKSSIEGSTELIFNTADPRDPFMEENVFIRGKKIEPGYIDNNGNKLIVQGDTLSLIVPLALIENFEKVEENGLASFTPNTSYHNNFVYTVDQDITLNMLTRLREGDQGFISFVQDNVGGHEVTFDTDYVFDDFEFNVNPSATATTVFNYTVISNGKVLLMPLIPYYKEEANTVVSTVVSNPPTRAELLASFSLLPYFKNVPKMWSAKRSYTIKDSTNDKVYRVVYMGGVTNINPSTAGEFWVTEYIKTI